MADETIADTNSTAAEITSAEPVDSKQKTRATRKKQTPKTIDASQPATTKAAAKAVKNPKSATPTAKPQTEGKRKKYTPAQRSSILATIEKTIKDGKTTLKAALQQADVSEQTYYNWKNAAGRTKIISSTVSSGDDLTSLVALEAENMKLRKELAEKLRAENAELRKRLGKA